MAGGEQADAMPLEYTPTWIVAVVCSVIVIISLALERIIHYLGKYLKRKNQKPLYEALQKGKEELMLLGFISLLLTVFQGVIGRTCIREKYTRDLLPCKKEKLHAEETGHFQTAFFNVHGVLGQGRRLLAEESAAAGHCGKGMVPLLSTEALHELHIFIFVLAIAHVIFSVLTMLLGGARIRQWKHWEDFIKKDKYNQEKVLNSKVIRGVQEHDFIREHFLGIGSCSPVLSWLHCFIKQFYGSVTKADYIALRLGFIMTHCRGNPKFDFHRYMVRALEADFKTVVGISWYLWIFVVIFLLMNVDGWHTYFWIAFFPLILLLAVGAKLEHVIARLAHDVAEKHAAIEGELVVQPSDDHFWFNSPKFVLFLIHFILFQNAFEIGFFFWIWTSFGFDSCIMGHIQYIIPRLIIGIIIQLLCSYSTLPLYAIVTQMGSYFKKEIFEEHVQESLTVWARSAQKKNRGFGGFRGFRGFGHQGGSSQASLTGEPSTGIQLVKSEQKEAMAEEGTTESVHQSADPKGAP